MRWALIASGVLVMAYAVAGALTDADLDPVGVAVFLAAVLVLHDAVFLPLVIAAGALIRRFVAPGWQATVRTVAVVDLAVAVVALPLVGGFGRAPDNPTVLPRPYGLGLALILMVTTVTGVAGRKGIERWRGRRRPRSPG